MANAREETRHELTGDFPGERQVVIEKDIDGLPLRDHKKVDLKAILGHFPQVDDDPEVEDECCLAPELENSCSDSVNVTENENEDEDDEDDQEENCSASRQRRSSIRTQQHDSKDSPPCERKAVRFADSLGLGLEAIRDLADAEEPPEIPHSALTVLRLRRRRYQTGRMVLSPTFQQPIASDEAFLARLIRQNVLLESSFVCSRELTVSGVVWVVNASHEKTVTIRYTTDSWSTHRDIPANYVPKSNDGTTDRFVFIIHLPEGFGEEISERQERLEFSVAYHAGGDTYWDNNDGANYVIDCVIRSRESSLSGEAKSHTDADLEPVDCHPVGVVDTQ